MGLEITVALIKAAVSIRSTLCLPIDLSIYLPIYLLIYLSTYLPIYLSIYLPIYLIPLAISPVES